MAKICPSDFDEPIYVQRASEVQRADGGWDDTWTDFRTIWARVTETSGSEPFQADRLESTKSFQFTAWYDSEILESDRLYFENEYLNITRIDNVDRRNEFMVIYADSGTRT